LLTIVCGLQFTQKHLMMLWIFFTETLCVIEEFKRRIKRGTIK